MFRELVQLAPRVYLFPHDETPNTIQPNIGILRLEEQTILIDAGNSPRHARQIMGAMVGQDFPPIDTIIYTHHHWDHTFAAATFNATTIIGHDYNAEIMAGYAAQQWNAQVLRERIMENPRLEVGTNAMIDAIQDWRDFRICQPTMSFRKTLTIYFDECRVELEYVGGRHARDSLIVRIPDAGVMFLGDSYYPLPLSQRDNDDDLDLDVAMMQGFVDTGYDMYVDGHGPARTRDEFSAMMDWEKKRQGLIERD